MAWRVTAAALVFRAHCADKLTEVQLQKMVELILKFNDRAVAMTRPGLELVQDSGRPPLSRSRTGSGLIAKIAESPSL